MPRYRTVPVMLSAGERWALTKRARGAKTAYRDWLRAQIVLAAAGGRASARIAADLHVSVDTVRKWRGRVPPPRLAPVRAAAADQRAAAGSGGRAGLPAARGHRGAAGALERPRAGRRDHKVRAGRADLAVLGAADLGRASHQALAVPVLDLPA